jgi:aminoglycoside/choline kinase family phosphotransferase
MATCTTNKVRIPLISDQIYVSWTQSQIAYSVVNPNASVPANLNTFPQPSNWPTHSPNTCNQYLPENTTIDRFVWVVKYLANAGFYVIIDDHT